MNKPAILSYVKVCLDEANAAFILRPDANNWNKVVRAMLVHQQAWSLFPSSWARVLERLADTPLSHLPEIVVEEAAGRSIDAVLKDVFC